MTVARNYGDPAAEYEAARSHAAVVRRDDRAFLRVFGRDPVKMVQGLVSNDVLVASADRAVFATVLTPKGKMIAEVRVLRLGDDLLMDTAASAADGLTAHLRRFVPPLFARFEPAPWSLLTLLGPHAAEMIARVVGVDAETDALPESAWTGRSGEHDVVILATSHADVPGFDLLTHPDAADSLFDALLDAGARPAGTATLEVLRIEAGTPRWGAELDSERIPLEAGLRKRAISETKGCYTGQEVIIRILHRGHVNWHLRGMLLGDAPTPAAGAELHNDAGKVVARITSAAWSPKHRQVIALGYARREVEPGSTLRLHDRDVTVVELPFPID